MRRYRYLKVYLYFTLILSYVVLLGSCGGNPQEKAANPLSNTQVTVTETIQDPEEEIISSSTMTPVAFATIQETFISPSSATESTDQYSESVAPTPSTTNISSLSPTYTSEPTSTSVTVACKNTSILPEKAVPAEVDMESSHVAVDKPYLYLAVEQYVGVFDISDSVRPEFWGFWDFPDLPDISNLRTHNGIAYVVSGSTLQMMNLSSQCQFAPIARIDVPFQIFDLEVENDRVYIGGYSEDRKQLHVAVFSIGMPSQPRKLGVAVLESAIWSVVGENLFFFLGLDELFVTDASDPNEIHPQPLNVAIDPEMLSRSWAALIEDTLYLLSERDGLTIIDGLREVSPTVNRNQAHYILVDIIRVQENYIFLGSNHCDGVDCASTAWILDAESGQELSYFGVYPHYPVYHYQEIRTDLIYAFSGDSLIVIDISNIADPMIIDQVRLTM